MDTTLYRGSKASGRHRSESSTTSDGPRRTFDQQSSSSVRRRRVSLDQSSIGVELNQDEPLSLRRRGLLGLSGASSPATDERRPVQPLSSELADRVRRLQETRDPRINNMDVTGSGRQKRTTAADSAEPQFSSSLLPQERRSINLAAARSMATSSSWNGGRDSIRGLAMGPHFIPATAANFQSHDDELGSTPRLAAADSAGSTWPPVESRALFWDSVRRVGVLSVLELERQMGLAPFRRSLGSLSSLSTIADEPGDDEHDRGSGGRADVGGGGGGAGMPLTALSESVSSPLEGVERQEIGEQGGFRRTPSLVSLHQAFVYNDFDDGDGVVGAPPSMDATADSAAVGIDLNPDANQRVADGVAAVPDDPVGAPVVPVVLSVEDALLFERLFDMHPFAAAAFLRAFIACSFALMLFHAHSLLTWPDDLDPHMAFRTSWGVGSVGRKWLLVQVAVLAVQVPLRMEVQRALFRVSTARDTADAKRRLRLLFASSAWRMNRRFGLVTLGLMLLGPVFLLWSGGFFWPRRSLQSGVELQLASVNASNLLVSITRAVLVVSLHYFIHMAAPPQPGAAHRQRGLSEGTIRRLRRITFCATTVKHENELTQCAVCLEAYEEDDRLMVLPCDPRHNFHVQCIEPWLQRMNTCPLCQRGVPEETPASSSRL